MEFKKSGVVRVSPFPAIQLGRDVRAECSKETERMGNEISKRGVLPCSEETKKEGEGTFLFLVYIEYYGTYTTLIRVDLAVSSNSKSAT